MRTLVLRAGGALLLLLAGLHLAVTPLIAALVQESAMPASAGWLLPPMLLNHVTVGVLLVPLGILTLYAAPHATAGARWAIITTRLSACTVATLPGLVLFFTGSRYFGAPFFRLAVAIAGLAAVVLLFAAFWPRTEALPNADTDSGS